MALFLCLLPQFSHWRPGHMVPSTWLQKITRLPPFVVTPLRSFRATHSITNPPRNSCLHWIENEYAFIHKCQHWLAPSGGTITEHAIAFNLFLKKALQWVSRWTCELISSSSREIQQILSLLRKDNDLTRDNRVIERKGGIYLSLDIFWNAGRKWSQGWLQGN